MYLDQSFFSTDVTAPISATFVAEGPGGSGYERTYTFTIPSGSIPPGFSSIDSCHVKSVACVDSCCAELQRQVNAITGGWVTAPTTSSSTGTPGSLAEASDFLYICVANDTWKRVAVSTW